MGSGGLRGLQILRSGAFRVRGGFDSHAFPPAFGRALAGVLAVPALALAVTTAAAGTTGGSPDARWARSFAVPESAAAEPDSTPPSEVIVIPRTVEYPAPAPEPDAAAGRFVLRTPPRIKGFDAPKWVMARSLLVPGWGQLHNGSWIKAAAIAAGEGLLIARLAKDNRALDDINQDIQAARAAGDDVAEVAAVTAYNVRLDQLVRRQWLFAALLTYSLLDAYIDAHFRNFEVDFEHDPALPGGRPPEDTKSGGDSGLWLSGETRIALRWSF
jgi:uncharacterized protein DUF5683